MEDRRRRRPRPGRPGDGRPSSGGAAAGAAEVPKQTFSITNDAHRVVECTFLVDGKTRNYLKVHEGKTFHDDFRPQTLLQLVCIRGAEGVFGPLKLGVDYRFVDRPGNHVGVVEAAGG